MIAIENTRVQTANTRTRLYLKTITLFSILNSVPLEVLQICKWKKKIAFLK